MAPAPAAALAWSAAKRPGWLRARAAHTRENGSGRANIESLTAFETGFVFALVIRGQPSDDLWGEGWSPFAERHQRRRRRASEGIDPDRLLFGIQFSDGSKATNLGNRFPEDDPPIPPVLVEGGGGGGGTE